MLEQNPIYDFMKSNKLTDLDEKTFLSKYSAADKAKEIHSFFVENDLTDLDSAKFYDKYLKKKELSVPSGEVSSPTELQSVSQDISLTPKTPRKDYYSTKLEKGLIFDKEGQLYAPSSEALSKDITAAEQASLKKSTQKDLVEKSREMPVVVEPTEPIEEQGLLLNLISSLDKSFAKNFISSPIKALGTALQGGTKKVMGGTGEGFISEPLIKLGDYLNKTIDELTPQDEEFKGTLTDQVAQAFGQIGSLILTGGLTGAAGKGAALVSQIPKGSAALTAVKTLGSQLASPTAVSAGLSMGQAEFDRAKEAGATDDQAFEVFYKNAVTGSVLETIPVMQFFKRFNNTTGGSVANYIKTKGVAGLTGGIEEMTTEVMQQLYSNKTAKDIYNINQDILDGVGASGGIGFGVGFVLNAMGANAKILKKQGKPREATAIENQIQQYEDNLKNPKVTSRNTAKDIVTQGVEIGTQKAVQDLDRDLANNVITPEKYQEGIAFAEKAAQVADKIPEIVTGESRVKSVELLVERNDIKQTNDNLIQQKQSTDEAYHAGIDEEIKANEERIKKIDSEVYNIAKKPSKEFGTKRYEIDGEEVSKEAFEALTGKPIGTKTIVEPTEIGGLKVIKRAQDAPNGEAVYEVEGERFLTADGKELKVAKVELPKKEVKPTEVKQEVKVKAPTKELAEGEEVTFNTPEGKKLTGEKITIPGFEKIDMVMVKDGLNNTVYDLASGSELVEGDFSKEGAIESLINQFKEKNITQPKIYGLIYKGSNVSAFESKDKVRQINPSSMFESYSEKRKAYDKAEYEKLPLKYTPKEIEELNKLKDKAIKNGLDEIVVEIDKRIEERGTGNKVNYYDSFDKAINNRIKEKAKKEAEKNKVPYPKEYIENFPKVTEDYLKTMVNSGYKVDKFAKIPADVKKVMIDGLQLSRDFMNKYGYHPYEQSDNFFTKLLYFMNSVGARESRESKIIESKKELVSALDDLKKVHEKEFGKKAETEAKPEGEVKSYSKKDLKDLEDLIENQVPGRPESFDGIWVKFKDLENNNIKNVAEGNIINFKDRRYLIDNIHNKNGYEVHLFEVDADNKVLRKKDIKFKNYNAEDLKKENDILKYDVAYDNNSYPESFVSLYTDIFSMKLGGYKNPKIGDVVNVFKKDYVVEGFIENKKNPDKTSVKLLRVDKDGNLLRSQDLPKKEIKAGLAKEEGEEEVEVEEPEQITKDDIKKAEAKFAAAEDRFKKARNKIEATQVKQAGMFGGEQKGMFAMGGEEAKSTLDPLRKAAKEAKAELDNVRNRIKVQEVAQPELKPIEEETPYQKALKEKQEADKRQNRQIGSEKAAITKEIYRKVNQMDAPADAEQIALRYLADGGKVSKEAIDEAYGSVKRAQLNTGRRELLSEEVKSKDFVQGNETLDETAHRLWEENNQRVSEIDIKNSLMAEIGNNNTRLEAAEAYLDNYNEEYKQEKEELRLAEQYKEEYLEEQEKIEKELREPLSEQIEGEASEEHINNLIDQYEAEIKGEDQQFGPASEGEVNKEASKGKVSEKTREAELAKEFKEATKKAGKKAKENAKKDYVDRNFEYIKEKIKIEKKCPT